MIGRESSIRIGETAVVSAAGCLLVAWAVTSLLFRPGHDQSVYLWAGSVIAEGGLPYRDAWDVKGPLVFYAYGIAAALFGERFWTVRLLDLLVAVLAAAVLWRLLRRLATPASAVAVALLYASFDGDYHAEPDGWVSWVTLAGFGPLLLAGPPSRWALVGSGLAIGVATLSKPLFIVLLAVPAVRVWLAGRSTALNRRGAALIVLLACALPLAACLLWFVGQGGLGSLIDAYLRFNTEVYAGAPARVQGRFAWLDETAAFAGQAQFALMLPFMVLGVLALTRRDRGAGIALGTWLALAYATVLLQAKFWQPHWLVLLAPFAVAAGIGAGHMFREENGGSAGARMLVAASIVLAMAFAAADPTKEVLDRIRLASGRMASHDYDRRFWRDRESREAAAVVRRLTHPGEHPGLGSPPDGLSSRRPEERQPLRSLPLVLGRDSELRRQYRRTFLSELRTAPARLFVVVRGRPSAIYPGPAEDDLHAFSELHQLLRTSYTHVESSGRFDFYRLRAPV